MYSVGKEETPSKTRLKHASERRWEGAFRIIHQSARGRHVEDGIVDFCLAEYPCAMRATDQEPRPSS
jgi:hypothetical protein